MTDGSGAFELVQRRVESLPMSKAEILAEAPLWRPGSDSVELLSGFNAAASEKR